MNPPPPSLSVVIPAHDAATWLPRTLAAVRAALAEAAWPDVEIVVVDDGSTDGTADVLAADAATGAPPPVRVVRQPRRGRFLARLAGLRAATGELVLLCDVRVLLEPGALAALRRRLAADPAADPAAVVWNGDIVIADDGNPYAAFWAAVVRIAWRRWFADRTEASFGLDDFDHYPKGTGFFVAPRTTLLAACDAFTARYDDLTLVSDDTHLIRGLAATHRIHLAHDVRATYHGRDDLTGFLRQAYYRGTTFVDGHARPQSRFFAPFVAAVAVAPVAVGVAVRRPALAGAVVAGGVGALGAVARRCGAAPHQARSLALLTPPFVAAWGLGVGRGLGLAASTGVRRRVPAWRVRTARRALAAGRTVLRNTPVQRLAVTTAVHRRLVRAAFGAAGDTTVAFRGVRVTMPATDPTTLPSLADGTYEHAELDALLALVRPGDTVVDVGANVGIWSVLLSRAVGPEGRVIALEPSPANLPYLARNLADNGCANVTVVPAAAGAAAGRAVLATATSGPTHRLRAEGAGPTDGRDDARDVSRDAGVEVDVVALDEVLRHLEVGAVQAVKIDVEGYEPAVLAGAPGVLAQRPALVVEFHAGNAAAAGQDWGPALAELFASYGAATVADGRRTTVVAGVEGAERVARSPKLLNLVFTPPTPA